VGQKRVFAPCPRGQAAGGHASLCLPCASDHHRPETSASV